MVNVIDWKWINDVCVSGNDLFKEGLASGTDEPVADSEIITKFTCDDRLDE